MYEPDEWEVPRESINLVKALGQGSFGMVYEGLIYNLKPDKPETKCAVKVGPRRPARCIPCWSSPGGSKTGFLETLGCSPRPLSSARISSAVSARM